MPSSHAHRHRVFRKARTEVVPGLVGTASLGWAAPFPWFLGHNPMLRSEAAESARSVLAKRGQCRWFIGTAMLENRNEVMPYTTMQVTGKMIRTSSRRQMCCRKGPTALRTGSRRDRENPAAHPSDVHPRALIRKIRAN